MGIFGKKKQWRIIFEHQNGQFRKEVMSYNSQEEAEAALPMFEPKEEKPDDIFSQGKLFVSYE